MNAIGAMAGFRQCRGPFSFAFGDRSHKTVLFVKIKGVGAPQVTPLVKNAALHPEISVCIRARSAVYIRL